MAARQPDPDDRALPVLQVGDTGLDAGVLVALGAAPVRIGQGHGWFDPLDPGPRPGPAAPSPAT